MRVRGKKKEFQKNKINKMKETLNKKALEKVKSSRKRARKEL